MSDSFEFTVSNKLKEEKEGKGNKRGSKELSEFNKKIMPSPF